MTAPAEADHQKGIIMGVQDSVFDERTGHYNECPQHTTPSAPRCYCEGIIAAQDGYYEEPTD